MEKESKEFQGIGDKPFSLLRLSDRDDMPTAVPLFVPCNNEYDPNTHTIVKRSPSSNRQRKQYLVPETLELIKNIVKPVAVLSICGPYRSGKSYFLSRILGVPNAFNISHTMKACTRGIWMATTALECDEFVIVFLDTEGTDDVAASESTTKCNFSLLVLTTLLSSCLIYNSMHVPRRTDLEAMSFLAQLASTVTSDCHDNEDDLRTLRWHFPNFLWLLRDVLQTPVDDNGEEVCLTTYIKEQVFSKSSSQVQSNVAQALLALFPSFECKKLPTPSLMPDILQNITENEASLSPMFNDAVSQVTREMLNSIKPKKVFGSETSFLTGPIIASLAVKYFDALNTPDSLPDILSNWQLLLEHRLTTVIETLVEEYKSEMEEALKEKLPMEADFQGEGGSHNSEEKYLSLFDIHQDILDQKFRMLQSELSRHIALSMNDQKEDVIEIFKKQIVQYKQNVNGRGGSVSTSRCSSDVVGGEFFRFVQENEEKSRKQCNQVFDDLSRPLIENLSKDLDTFQERYYSLAIGPAKDEVYASKREQFDKVANQLPPGPPGDLKPIGRGNDRVKLTWLKPTHHRRAVKNYEIQMRRKRNWITITEIRKHSLIVVSLKPSTTYHFRVRGNNTNEVGQWSEEAKIKTRLSTGARYGVTAASFVGGTLCAPVVITALTFKEAYEVVKSSKRLDEKVLAGTGMVIGGTMLPVMVACSTLMAPAAGAVAAEGVYELTGVRCEDNLDDTECEYVDIVQLLNQSNTNPQICEEILHEVNSDGTEEELTTTDCQPEQEARFTLSHSTPDTPSPSSKFLESTSSNEEGYEAENESDDIERRTSLTSSISVKNYDETFSASFNLSSFADSENPPEVFTWQIDHHDDTTC